MKEIIYLVMASGLLFLGFLVTLILGIVKRKLKLVVAAVTFFLFFSVTVAYTGYKFISKSYRSVTEAFKPRTGEEIYTALFGKDQFHCTRVINHQDQVVPVIDYAIWLHFNTCPEELDRILSAKPFEKEKTSTKGWNTTGPLANDNWFKPELLGDTILVYTFKKDDYGNGQIIYTNLDKTEVYCQDVWD